MNFKEAAEAVPALNGSFRPGKQALKGEHRARVTCESERRLKGSVDLDGALAGVHCGENRWGYGLGYQPPGSDETAVWIEVHHASTGEVGSVLKKLEWLKSYLRNHAPGLWSLTQRANDSAPAFVWLATNGVHITSTSPQARRLSQAGLSAPRRTLNLP